MIALDIDGVLADTLSSMTAEVASRFDVAQGRVTRLGDWTSALGIEGRPDLQPSVDAYMQEAWRSNEAVYSGAPALQGALRMALELHLRGVLSGYVTRRNARLADVTARWLRREGMPQLPVIHAQATKAEECRKLGASVIVEDSPHEIEALTRAGIEVIMPVYPYNRHLIGEPMVTATTELLGVPRLAEYLIRKRALIA